MAKRTRKKTEDVEFEVALDNVIEKLETQIRQQPDPLKQKIDRLKDAGFDDNRIAAMLMINVEKVKKLK